MALLLKFVRDEDGAVSIEYALIGGLVSIVIVSAVMTIGSNISNMFFGPVGSALSP